MVRTEKKNLKPCLQREELEELRPFILKERVRNYCLHRYKGLSCRREIRFIVHGSRGQTRPMGQILAHYKNSFLLVTHVPERSELPPKVILGQEDDHAQADGCYCTQILGKSQKTGLEISKVLQSRMSQLCVLSSLCPANAFLGPLCLASMMLAVQRTPGTLVEKPNQPATTAQGEE